MATFPVTCITAAPSVSSTSQRLELSHNERNISFHPNTTVDVFESVCLYIGHFVPNCEKLLNLAHSHMHLFC